LWVYDQHLDCLRRKRAAHHAEPLQLAGFFPSGRTARYVATMTSFDDFGLIDIQRRFRDVGCGTDIHRNTIAKPMGL
jgi:hypothetical protein